MSTSAVELKFPTREEFEALAKQEMEKMFDKVPYAREFNLGQAIDQEYYKRHLMETIIRIGLNNEVDSYSLYKIGYKDNLLAQKLAQYLAEEFGHDSLFLHDLKKFGVSEAELRATKPFFTTEMLIGYIYYSINQDGPIPTMVWNWFVEWYSDNYNKNITKKAGEEYGKEKTKGMQGHLDVDDDEDHVGLMFGTIIAAMKKEGDGEKAQQYLMNFINLIGMYFQELYDTTIGARA